MTKLPWPAMSCHEVLKYFGVDQSRGLTAKEAARRLEKSGYNMLVEKEKTPPWLLFLHQFRDFMVLVLLAATLLSGMLGEYSDALTIMVIVLLNALLGFIQEYRAEQSLAALRGLTAPTARVLRDGVRNEVPALELVPGDIVLLEAGDRVAADIRLCEARQLTVNEAPLTGESEPVTKQHERLAEQGKTPGDQVNMAFMGTLVTSGRGSGVVVATGMQTEMGRVAHLLQDISDDATPLQKRLEQMGRLLVAACFLLCSLVVIMGLARGLPAYKMFMAGVSLAVAAIPEGLPAVVTIALAVGVQRMVRKNAIVRRLPAVETLGCATVICSDKTGTLTQNKMNVCEIWAGGTTYKVEGQGYSPLGGFSRDVGRITPSQEPALLLALKVAVLCNNAQLRKGNLEIRPLWRKTTAEWDVDGDPTEGALLVAGARAGLWRGDLERQARRIQEIPFDGQRKRMSVIYEGKEGAVLYVKGAPEVILSLCSHIFYEGKVRELTAKLREEVLAQTESMAAQALRNLAVAYRFLPARKAQWEDEDTVENNLVLAGLLGIMDPPRPEVAAAIARCHTAGIRTVMITGDHKTTAVAVARMLNLLPPRGRVLTGEELNGLSENQLEKAVESTYVYARVTPEHKLRIVRALKRRGHVVAMTGDGVNDAPAVKEADIGIAMGRSGTDVTREAASLVLADDNFATIVNAVEEGRGIYDNIRKFIRFLLACNTGEILTMLLAMLLGLPLPLRAIQILWINLATDGLPAMALGLEPVEPSVMKRAPRPVGEGIFARGLWRKILGRGALIGISTLFVFSWSLGEGMTLDGARTMAFTTLIVTQLCYVFDCRSETGGIREVGLMSNLYLVGAVLSSFCLLLAVLYHPGLASVFGTIPLEPVHWAVIFAVSLLPEVFNSLFLMLRSLVAPRVVFVRK